MLSETQGDIEILVDKLKYENTCNGKCNTCIGKMVTQLLYKVDYKYEILRVVKFTTNVYYNVYIKEFNRH